MVRGGAAAALRVLWPLAARAQAHFSIEKHTEKGRTAARLAQLDADGRLNEIARMLGGRTVTPRVLAHARELMGL